MNDLSEIQVLAQRETLIQRKIVRRLVISRAMMKRALTMEQTSEHERAAVPTALNP